MTWDPILEAVAEAVNGPSESASAALGECWNRTSAQSHAQRCVLAHYLADQQQDLESETRWDEQALAEFAHVQDEDLVAIGVPSAAGFAPSLHLNLGDDYLRAGDHPKARTQLEQAQQGLALLPIEGYGAMIRGGVQRLQERIEASDARA